MTAKKEATERTPKQALADHFRKSQAITPSELAEVLDRDPKVVRGYLRKIAARDQATMKGQRWTLTKEVAEQAVEHYSAAKRAVAE